jgi:hypothetical protein
MATGEIMAIDPGDFQGRRVVRMQRFDTLPKPIRDAMNEYGQTIVDAFLQAGVTNPRHIRHIVETVRAYSGQYANGKKAETRKLETERA